MKKDVCVIFGGKSPEHDVSVISANTIYKFIDKNLYNVHMLYITKKGEWKLCDEGPETAGHKAFISPDSTEKCIVVYEDGKLIKIKIDVVFIALHGKNGEDGTIQGLLELAEIPYTGSGVFSSALCMDKAMAKYIFDIAGIPQVDWRVITPQDMEADIQNAAEELGYPVFVKPSRVGSSFGTAKVRFPDELIGAVEEAFRFDTKVILEKFVKAREIECAIMGNEKLHAAKLGEIVYEDSEYYDYETKYESGGCELYIPSKIDDITGEMIKRYALKAYKAADCRGFARVDFFVSKDDNSIYLNEINTIPGFTDGSIFPLAWHETGVSITDTITAVINYAMEKEDDDSEEGF